jgi:hypothetical protein
MKRRAWRVLAAVALASIFQAAALAAENSTVAYEEGANGEVSVLRAEIDALRSQLHMGMAVGYNNNQPPAPTPATGGEAKGGTCGCGAACGGCGCGCGTACGCGAACGCGCGQTCCNSCCCETGGTCGCFEPCCHCPGLWVSAELMWFRYHRADGVRVGVDAGEDAEFDFEITPRLTAGWVGQDGLGARLRYWEFDHSADAAEAGGSSLNVDTYVFDFEVFDTFCLNRNWDLELAAGIRYNEFLEVMVDIPAGENEVRLNSFSGFGVLSSAELRRLVGTNGAVFVRARGAILMDDKDIFNTTDAQQEQLLDVTVGMTELAFGYDYVSPLWDRSYTFVRLQAEWQNWYNYSSSFVDTANNEAFGGPSDVGFGGFGIGVGWIR